MSDRYKLDGTEKVENHPFDAHERAVAAKAAEYTHQEYPKHLASGVIVNNAEEEAAYKEGE